ncbi:DUF2971 domain-containing protein [Pseudomonas fulva]|uniref:DUF2971 domain-containing protein n=1 Tax=Pseudomonas putida group TaxID=136845 RepID=UPI000AD26128|nr:MULTISPECIES: DUF2971 domain-containing protein [Pseudomonas putida group]MBA1220657.1 DUF2971 domain-containing protein [Pseudomonas fulva]MBH3452057.1 DUF2971 domain-containing protein [Pseudomonas putida]MDQ2486798.1 DUF2971 domain-containing protein [Pseudomonas putida]
MRYDKKKWLQRSASRSDITGQVTHLTKGTEDEVAIEVLIKILRARVLIGSTTASGFIVGNTPAVCFQEAPLYSICQNCQYEAKDAAENERAARYTAYGLMFQKDYIYNEGGRPVLYENTKFAKTILPEDQWWRIVSFNLSNSDGIIDWTHEREWRMPNNFRFDISKATIIVPNPEAYKNFYKLSKIGGEDVASEVRTVISVGAVFL